MNPSINGQDTSTTTGDFDFEHPFRPICAAWTKKIELAKDHKKKQFDETAAECMLFYNGGAMDLLYNTGDLKEAKGLRRDPEQNWPAPTFQMQANKVNEVVGLFGPVLYHKEPYRQVNPRLRPQLPKELFDALAPVSRQEMIMGPNPQMQMLSALVAQLYEQEDKRQEAKDAGGAKLLEWYLNYTPRECGLKDEARLSIDEALIKGMGVGWTEVVTPLVGPKLVSTFYDTVDNLVIDPDVEQIKDAKWIARRCVHPVWQVEKDHNLPKDSLKRAASMESYRQQGNLSADDNADYHRKRGDTNDLIVYWKVYSKMGVGGRLAGADPKTRDALDTFGDYAYLVIAPNIPYPLNVPTEMLKGPPEAVHKALEWPVPFWIDDKGPRSSKWPMVPLYFRTVPRQLWPMAHFAPAMGYLKAINWVYSMALSKIGITCRDFIAMLKSVSQDIKDAVLHGRDFTILEVAATGPQAVGDLVQFLQHPPMQADVWKVLEMLKEEFEKATGLSELVYGMSSRQMRSAQEATLKGDQISVRPDDMANKVEDWSSMVARNEAIAIAWIIKPEDVEPMIGKGGAFLWGQLVTAESPANMLNKLETGIEAGSTKKPNKDRDAANMQQAMQNLFQPFFAVAQATGWVDPVNALMADWAKSLDLDASKYMFPALPPPPPPTMPGPGGAEGGGGTGDASQAEEKQPAPQGEPAASAGASAGAVPSNPVPSGSLQVGGF